MKLIADSSSICDITVDTRRHFLLFTSLVRCRKGCNFSEIDVSEKNRKTLVCSTWVSKARGPETYSDKTSKMVFFAKIVNA